MDFILFNLFSWDSYFSINSYKGTLQNKYFYRRKASFFQKNYVLDCYFENQVSDNSGGAINIEYESALMIESSIFLNCAATFNGGGVNYGNTNDGECVICKTCAYGCRADSWGQFSSVLVSETLNNKKNYFDDSSSVKSENPKDGSYGTLNMYYSDIRITRSNLSNNKISGSQAFIINKPKKNIGFLFYI